MLRTILAALAAVPLLTVAGGAAEPGQSPSLKSELTVDRLFAEPDLSGPAPANVKVAPDGSRIGFLRAADDDRLRYDLWEYDLDSGESRLLVDARDLVAGPERLSEEELARRERQRISSRRGIVDYHFAPDGGALLFPLSGDLYLYSLDGGEVRRLTGTEAGEIDPKFSPGGHYVSFVREGDLHVIDLEDGAERRLTRDGSELVKNGLAEFIAQEEMGRDTGYWWAPDESAIAYLQVDESPVEIVERFEIHAEEFEVYEQRYPTTGTPNVVVRLGVVSPGTGAHESSGNGSGSGTDRDTGENRGDESGGGAHGERRDEPATRWLDLGDETDIYVPRVAWFPDSRHLAVQRQSRDQQLLELLKLDTAEDQSEVLIAETSDTWIDIYDELEFLPSREAFVWASARDGHKHLYLYDYDGKLLRRLTAGPWEVTGDRYSDALLHVDDDAGDVYFLATEKSPLERHVYVTSLDTAEPERLRRLSEREGWHVAEFSPDGEFYVDSYSAPDTPPQVSVHRRDGSRIGYIEKNELAKGHPYFPHAERHALPIFGTLEAADGQTLHYYVRAPVEREAGRRHPAVVIVYGGPHGQRVRKAWGDLFEQVLTRRGYVVFSLDNRGTDFRGTAFDAPLYRRMGHVEVADQLVGVEYLKSLPYVDADRIGVFGWSYGGYMTLMMLMQAPDAFAAGVSGAPVTDWRLYDTHYTERYLSTPQANPEGYEASSVFPYAADLATPLLLIHGMADDNVLFSHSTKLMHRLQREDVAFDLMTYPGSKHGLLRGHDEGRHAYKAMLRFLDRHLKR